MPRKFQFNTAPIPSQMQGPQQLGAFAPTSWNRDGAGAPMADGFGGLSFEQQNRLNNGGVYAPGSHGAASAAANGTGAALPDLGGGDLKTSAARALAFLEAPVAAPTAKPAGETAAPAAAGGSTVSSTRGQPGVGRALEMMADAPAGVPELAGVPSPLLAAAGFDAQQANYDGERAHAMMSQNGLAPWLPGETPAARNTRLALAADRQRLTTPPPERYASDMGAFREMTLRSAGLPVAEDSGRPVTRGTDRKGGRTLGTGDMAFNRNDPHVIDVTPRAPAAADRNAAAFAVMGDAGRRAINKAITKPKPGSEGYETTQIPDVGTVVTDRATGDVLPSSSFNRPEKKNDEKSLTQTEIQQVNALQQSGRDLDALEQAFTDIGDKDWGGPISGRLKEVRLPWTDKTLMQDPNAQRIASLVTGATPNLARGVFREVGVLTDQDVARYKQLLPNDTDTAAVRQQKFKDLRARLVETIEEQLGTLSAAGRDVAGLRERILGKDSAPNKSAAGAAITPEAARAELARRKAAGKGGK